MKYSEFWILLFENFEINFGLFILILLILHFFFRKEIYCIIDPLEITLIAFSSILTVLIILKTRNLIENLIFYKSIIINLNFLIFLKFFLKKTSNKKITKKQPYKLFKIFYTLHSILFLFVICIYINTAGIKGFSDKLNIFQNKGYLNILKSILIPGQLILVLIKRKIYNCKNILDTIFIPQILIGLLLSGSKTSLVFFTMYIFIFYKKIFELGLDQKFYLLKKYEKKIIIVLLIFVILVFKYVTKSNSLKDVFMQIVFRIIAEADMYYFYYPNKIYEKVGTISLFNYYIINIFRPVISRLINYSPKLSLGYPVVRAVYDLDVVTFGPNTRADIIWQQNFILIACICAMATAYIYAKFRNYNSMNFFKLYLAILGIVNIDLTLRDISLFANEYLHGVIFVIFPLYLISLIVFKISQKQEVSKIGGEK